jgi:hypothetical protein
MSIQWSATCNDAADNYNGIGGPTGGYPTVAPAQWMQVTGSIPLPADCTGGYLQIVQNGPPASDAGNQFPNLYVDDVYINH